MNLITKLGTAVSVAALLTATPVVAQQAITGIENLDDRIDDITETVEDDLAKGDDPERFGPLGVPQGWRGSLAFSASSTDGNTDTGEISLGGRLTYGVGKWSHNFGIAAEYGRTNKITTDEEFFATYEANRHFTEQFYMFGIGRYNFDGIGPTEHEAFLGFGPGIRVVNTDQTTWRVQAGPGALYTKTSAGVDDTELSGILSSRVYHRFNDTVSLTNDTDVLFSESTTIATNDFGVNYKLTDMMSTRFSYRTEFDDSRAIKTDNKLGVSLVIGF